MTRAQILSVPFAAMLLAGACGTKPPPTVVMGEHVQVGSLQFNVLDAEWLADLPGEMSPRLPKNRFLVLRVSASNQGTRELHVPLLRLENVNGETFAEVEDATGLDDWWGLIRPVSPGATDSRRILFDVAPAEYKLHLSDGGDPEREQTAIVTIPYRIKRNDPLALPEPEQGPRIDPDKGPQLN
ncbi:MAG: hypothetical protein R2729_20810 [Bryobacteraceae bacterium]